ncbi:MAG: peptidoglycan-associated lipoprotein Pal [Candidatus Hydrogenedentes bacterium]|nr:peptidoglycan-associated lipoprotein Pal [Candidatus Hydrogenedentota bacterium]
MKTASWRFTVCALSLAVILAASNGCAKKKKDQQINPDLTSTSTQPETTTSEGLPDVEIEKLLFDRAAGLKNVYFDYDKYALRPDAIATLKENADLLKKYPNVLVQIAGHCDERGTQEYNLALGEKRALSTREYLMQLGISGDRLVTISYGEEMPAAPGHDESAWSQNRRCEFNKAM